MDERSCCKYSNRLRVSTKVFCWHRLLFRSGLSTCVSSLGQNCRIPYLGCTGCTCVSRHYITSLRRAGSLLVWERVWFFSCPSFCRGLRPCVVFPRVTTTHINHTASQVPEDLGYCAAESPSHALLRLLEHSLSQNEFKCVSC